MKQRYRDSSTTRRHDRQGAARIPSRRLLLETLEERKLLDATPLLVGPELLVNTTTSGSQQNSDVAMDAAGNFVVVWEGVDDDDRGIFARRFSSAGQPLGNEFRVNESSVDNQVSPAVAMDEDGDFVVVWSSEYIDGSGLMRFAEVRGRRFDSDGAPLGSFVADPVMGTQFQRNPDVAMDISGDQVVAWDETGASGLRNVFLQRYSSLGAPQGGKTPVNVDTDQFTTPEDAHSPAVAMDEDGDFVVAFDNQGASGYLPGIFARQFAADGTPRTAAEFRVDNGVDAVQHPAAGMDAAGGFVIAWSELHPANGTAAHFDILARRYSAAGVPQDVPGTPGVSEFLVNTDTIGDQVWPAVGMNGVGQFLIVWEGDGNGQVSDHDIYGQFYEATGARLGIEFEVNTTEALQQRVPSAALNDNCDIIVTWDGNGQQPGQIDDQGIFAQRLECACNLVVDTTLDLVDPNDNLNSLREAILCANLHAGIDTISFAIPGSGVQTISPLSALPTITDPVIIDGYTQPGATPNTLAQGNNGVLLIELAGSSAGGVPGLHIAAGGSTVRGLVINRFAAGGILLNTAGGNVVSGNFIGTDPAGTHDLGNGNGIVVAGIANNTIGGAAPEARNLISGNSDGVLLQGPATGNRIEGNYVGTNAAGTAALGNGGDGIDLDSASFNFIIGNLISGNGDEGLELDGGNDLPGGDATGNIVQRNRFGTNAAGTATLPNGDQGIEIENATNNTIGGTAPGEGNIITGSVSNGILIHGPAATGNALLGNSIFANELLGIELSVTSASPDGVTPNDAGDADTGPNNLQNFPVITSVSRVLFPRTPSITEVRTSIEGTLNSVASTQFIVQLFASDSADPSGHGEGQFFLTSFNVTTNPTGDATFAVVVDGSPSGGRFLTATATRVIAPGLIGETSEFSAALLVPVAVGVLGPSVTEGDVGTANAVFNVILQEKSSQTVTVAFSTADNTATGEDYRPTSGTLTFAPGQTRGTITVLVNGDTDPEPNETFFLNLSATNGQVFNSPRLGTILDDDVDGRSILVTGADAGGGPHVKVFDASTNELLFDFFAYNFNFRGGVRVAVGDINGDGADDIVTGAGPGGGPHVRVFDGRTGAQLPGRIGSFFAYNAGFRGGVFVAAGDVNADGFVDVITGADAGGGPHVMVFDGRTGFPLPGKVGNFFAYKPEFNGGVRVAAGDVNGDGRADVITGMGAGYAVDTERSGFTRLAQPEVRVFSGAGGDLIRSFLPFEAGYRGGVHLAVGHFDDDLRAEIIVSKANGDNRTDAVFNRLHIDPFRRAEVSVFQHTDAGPVNRIANFVAYPSFGGSVRVAAIDQVFRDFDPGDDYLGPALFTGAGPGGGPHAKLFSDDLALLDDFFAYDFNFRGGTFVAASNSRELHA